MKLIERILRSSVHIGKPEPNVCYSIYKNRGGKYTRVKIWLYVDYDTMRVHDQFCTDYEYNLISIPQTYVGIDEDQKVVISNEKDRFTKALNKATYIMNQIADDGIDDIVTEDFDDINDEAIGIEISSMSPEDVLDMKINNKLLSKKELEDDEDDELIGSLIKKQNDSRIEKDNKISSNEVDEFINEVDTDFKPTVKPGSKLSLDDFDY